MKEWKKGRKLQLYTEMSNRVENKMRAAASSSGGALSNGAGAMQVHSAEALLALFNCLQHAVTLVDRDGRVILANTASGEMWGARVEAGSEERLLPLLFSHDPAALTEAMAALDQGSTWRGLLPVPLGRPPAADASLQPTASGYLPPPRLPAGTAAPALRATLSAQQVSFLPADTGPSPQHSKDPHICPGGGGSSGARPVAHGPMEPPTSFEAQPPAPTPATPTDVSPGSTAGPVEYVGPGVQALHGPDATAGSTGRRPASAAAARRNCSLDLAEGPAARGQEPGGQAASDPRPSAGSSSLQQRRRVLRRRHSQIALGHGTNSTQTGHSAAGVLEELAAVPPRPAPPKEAPPAGTGASATTRPAVAGVTARAPVRRAISVIALGEVPALAAPLTVRQQLVAGLQLSAWGPALMRGHQPPRAHPQPGRQPHHSRQQPQDPLGHSQPPGLSASAVAAAAAAAEGSALMAQRSASSWSDQYAWRNPSDPRRGYASANIIFAAAAAARAAAADIVTAAAEEDVGAETFMGLSTDLVAGAQLVPHIYSSASSGASVRGLGAALADGPLSAGHQSQPHRSRSFDHVGTVALERAAGLLAVAGGSVGASGGTGGSAALSSGWAGSGAMGRLLSITLQSITRGAAPMAGGAGRQRNASFHLSDLDRIHERQNPLHQHHQHRQDSQHREDRHQQQLPNGHASGTN
ncbi:hypothetical protein TSOC_014033, partial [Tetrabaena socialis]